MSIIKFPWINICRLMLTPKKLIINKRTYIHQVRSFKELTINKLLDGELKFADDQWSLIRKELFDSGAGINEANVDCIIIDTCRESDNKNLGLNYVQHLIRNENKNLNLATVGKYFKLLYDSKKVLDSQEIEEVYRLYDEIRTKYPIVDAITAEYLILGLSLTERWRECVELLDMITITSSSHSASFSSIISAAFDHDEFKFGWELLSQMFPRLQPSQRAYDSFLKYCTRTSNNSRELEYVINKLFELWKANDVLAPSDVITAIVDLLVSTGEWVARKTSIGKDGTCEHCSQALKPLDLKPEDFQALSDLVLSKNLIGGDVYGKTTPEELKQFKKFVDSTKPYDVCIDGLNAAYTLSRTQKSSLGQELATVVEKFVSQNKKVFILGRKHMNKWSAKHMSYIRKHCYLFFANNLSQDDPFLLYATLASGINSYFVSRDLMRRHKFDLQDDKTRQLFRHWQISRQIFPTYVGTNFHRTLLLIYPPKYLPVAQKNSHGWHLPCSDDPDLKSPDLHIPKPPQTWICLRRN
ncbi:mitochondrial ribonuclease P catalytic subunit [Microplitis mediator]|uniref:mitochondrial ribonuclease P catalytic subunit n=1 Tax=Microplitis mediator TaxID=375433 RepID=UPI0025538A46|nr:mitochondrial ribonuclease P catalytic subunit [Microplitis mediator]